MIQRTPQAEPASERLSIKCIDSIAGMDAMRCEWQALENRAANSLAYFQSYDWCRNWCTYFATESNAESKIRIYVGHIAGRLAFVWPLMLIGDRHTIRQLVCLTEPYCQYGNVLVDLDAGVGAEGLVEDCWRTIGRENVDAVVVDNVPGSKLAKRLCANGALTAVSAGLNSAMDLTEFGGCYVSYRASLKSTTRRSRNKRRNKLAAHGTLGYRVHFGGTREYAALVRTGIDMKRLWLRTTGRATRALNLPHVDEFLASLPNTPAGDNGAVAAALTLDGRPIAVEIGFLYHQRFYSYLGAFDWDLRDFSPGKLQLEEAVKWCLERGIETYDLLGDASAYKLGWRNVTTQLTAYQSANTIRGRGYLTVWRNTLRPAFKRTFERMPLGLRSRLIPTVERRAHAAMALARK